MMFPKDGALRSKVYLDFVRGMRCWFCDAPGKSHAHHYPPKGMGGADIDDTKTIPVCPSCHARCHGQTIVRDGVSLLPYQHDDQRQSVNAVMRVFVTSVSFELAEKFHQEVARWRERRVFAVVP